MLKVSNFGLSEVLLLEYPLREDNRGISVQTFSKRELFAIGITTDFIEEVHYFPKKKNTLFGIHFQNHPKPQTKLIYCTKGKILDFAVDLRNNSPSYKKWACIELTPENRKQVYIPAGFGHAALTLEDDTIINYMIDEYPDTSLSRAIKFNDPDLNISFGIMNPILSQWDIDAPFLKESDCNL